MFLALSCSAVLVAAAGNTDGLLAGMAKLSPVEMAMQPFAMDSMPSIETIASFINPRTGSAGGETARMIITASVPSVNLENVPGFVSITCVGATARATFTSSSGVLKWKHTPTLLVIAARHRCGPGNKKEVAMKLARSWTVADTQSGATSADVDAKASSTSMRGARNHVMPRGITPLSLGIGRARQQGNPASGGTENQRASPEQSTSDDANASNSATPLPVTEQSKERESFTVVFQTSDPQTSGVKAEFRLSIYPLTTDNRDIGGNSGAMTSSAMMPLLPTSKSVPILATGGRLRRRFLPSINSQSMRRRDFHTTFNGGFTFLNPLTDQRIGTTCRDCYFKGLTSLTVNVLGSLFPVSARISIEWDGDIELQTDTIIRLKGVPVFDNSASVTFINLPLHPFSIPGLLLVNPVFRVRGELGFTIESNADIHLKLVSNMQNANVELSSSRGLSSNRILPVFEGSASSDREVTGNLYFAAIAEFATDVVVFHKKLDGTPWVGIKVARNNNLILNNLKQVCFESTVSTSAVGNLMISNLDRDIAAPYELYKSCSDPKPSDGSTDIDNSSVSSRSESQSSSSLSSSGSFSLFSSPSFSSSSSSNPSGSFSLQRSSSI